MTGSAVTPPRCLGLTGGIGSGKSTALAAFARHGAATLSSDAVVHGLYADPDVIAAVTRRFGRDVLRADGSVDRATLGDRAFADPEGIAFLNRLLHPRIGPQRDAWIAARRADDPPPPLIVCEVPLLFEAGLAGRFDAVLVVTATEDVRRARVEERGQEFASRAGLQWPEQRKVDAADRVYVNDGSLGDLDAWVRGVMAEFGRR